MSRSMGDAIHANVQTLVPLQLQMVAGYDTGTPDIKWTAADWALFPGVPHVHIDQGYGVRSHSANVLDFETGAFSPDMAAALINLNTSPDPTIYVNRSNMLATIASAVRSPNWRGAVWLAFPGWDGNPAALPPLPATCRYVAVQNQLGGPYDLSRVLDDTWPGGPMKTYSIPGIPGTWTGEVTVTPNADGSVVVSGYGTNGNLYVVKYAAGKWGNPVPA